LRSCRSTVQSLFAAEKLYSLLAIGMQAQEEETVSSARTWVDLELLEAQLSSQAGVGVCRQRVCQCLEDSLVHRGE